MVTRQSSFVVDKFPGINTILDSLFSLFFIFGYKNDNEKNQVEIFIKYDSNGNPIIRDVK
jgi:hypothetical protein